MHIFVTDLEVQKIARTLLDSQELAEEMEMKETALEKEELERATLSRSSQSHQRVPLLCGGSSLFQQHQHSESLLFKIAEKLRLDCSMVLELKIHHYPGLLTSSCLRNCVCVCVCVCACVCVCVSEREREKRERERERRERD